mmetsp:Transcript_15300/g.23830  ORF Transcript_15300/g.23830 Transcript_15300/m.23830 type:complete len:468 (-) Transcript_15300:186-1589(-)|eukprot:CAMPEP_0195295598 /NCGR_PEP_ID=MMETSP0707-20130614/17672_1 /TAXON_ID=33640 /ORGANISM="Asterionellopsis glacialis, Strain CCMP134" /LENGTH=467 /DNA_ID=CAMNT_0040356853 /DNA_START=46 /DNA_END=1452 /DNA_ORIENTATION=+
MTPPLNAVSMIHIKRWNQRPHTDEELQWWIEAYTSGAIPEYQMAAWLMAVCWRGMTPEETASLTKHMVLSGDVVKWPSGLNLVDKHSTGGVGDKISLVLAPLVAACGVNVPMMAGRGLDHTGGTLDKLESIPGYKVNLSLEEFKNIVETVGCSICSAGADMVPADRKLYALRDVTGTVAAIPLQTASIVSKKIAEGPQTLVLDVKYGRAAFQDSMETAEELAHSMIKTAEANGVTPTTAVLTRMDQPIGYAVGNWLEVKECIQIMRTGKGSQDLLQLILVLAAQMLYQSKKFPNDSFEQLVELARNKLKSGAAYTKFRKMVEAQGGAVTVLDHPQVYPKAKSEKSVLAKQDGYVKDIDALDIGRVSVSLGAGRMIADEPVSATAGIWFDKKVGDAVSKGDVICSLYTDLEGGVIEDAVERVSNAIQYCKDSVKVPPIASHIVSSDQGAKDFIMPEILEKQSSSIFGW